MDVFYENIQGMLLGSYIQMSFGDLLKRHVFCISGQRDLAKVIAEILYSRQVTYF